MFYEQWTRIPTVLRRVTGAQVLEAMTRERLTPKELAHELGVKPRTVQYWRTDGLTAKSAHYGELVARLRLGEGARIEELQQRVDALEAALRKQERLARAVSARLAAIEESFSCQRPPAPKAAERSPRAVRARSGGGESRRRHSAADSGPT
jgi:hypothetical protein